MPSQTTAIPSPQPPPGPGEAPPAYVEHKRAFPHIPPTRTSQTVTVDECVAHLRLLAVFADLRDSIAHTDGLFGLRDADVHAEFDAESDRARALALVREKRWSVYVARAVDRFEQWWFRAIASFGPRITVARVDAPDGLANAMENPTVPPGTPPLWRTDTLPPLDVLLVWHAFCLNPTNYLEDCLRSGHMRVWNAGFPWSLIDACINSSLDYLPSAAAADTFQRETGRAWKNQEDPLGKNVQCPRCSNAQDVPWLTGGPLQSLHKPWSHATAGWTDTYLSVRCASCAHRITHDELRTAKFRRDFGKLLAEDEAMPGSILSFDGHPPHRYVTTICQSYASHMLKEGIPTQVQACLDMSQHQYTSLTAIRDLIERGLADRAVRKKVGGKTRVTVDVAVQRRVSIRSMMSRYWENSSPFALDLVGAVLRQGTFIRKMDEIDWLHSPALTQTMERLIAKYAVFLRIMQRWPRSMAVPTLDVDLAWHSHQLMPARYYCYTVRYMNRMINHDDKVAAGRLSDAFELTSKRYAKLTNGLPYSECTCWYCEAVREGQTSRASPALWFSSSTASHTRTNSDALHTNPHIHHDQPERNAHISAHNAVPTEGGHATQRAEELRHRRLRSKAESAQRRLHKRGLLASSSSSSNEKDARNSDSTALAWGVYPVYMPFYAPYYPDPYITAGASSGMYPCNPACAAAGGAGTCVAGACGGAVAAGGCSAGGCSAIGGFAGCSAMGGCGAAGGCGGGGGGGGGGCGGGGC